MVCPVLLTFHLWDSENDSCSCYQLEIVQHSFHDLTHRSGCSIASSHFQRTSRKVGQEKKRLERNLTNHYSMPLSFVINPGHKTSLLYVLKKFKILPNDPETKHKKKIIIFSTTTHFIQTLGAHLSLTTNQEPSHVNAHNAKLVPLFLTQLRSQDPISGPNLRTQSLHASP